MAIFGKISSGARGQRERWIWQHSAGDVDVDVEKNMRGP